MPVLLTRSSFPQHSCEAAAPVFFFPTRPQTLCPNGVALDGGGHLWDLNAPLATAGAAAAATGGAGGLAAMLCLPALACLPVRAVIPAAPPWPNPCLVWYARLCSSEAEEEVSGICTLCLLATCRATCLIMSDHYFACCNTNHVPCRLCTTPARRRPRSAATASASSARWRAAASSGGDPFLPMLPAPRPLCCHARPWAPPGALLPLRRSC